MSQRDLVAELRVARPSVPPEVREHVRALVAAAEPPRRTLTLRRALAFAIPVTAVAAAAVVAIVVATRPSSPVAQQEAERGGAHPAATPPKGQAAGSALAPSVHTVTGTFSTNVPSPLPSRAQRYSASLALRLHSSKAVSDGVKRALRTTTSLGGYPLSVHVSAGRRDGSADLVVKVPRLHVREAVARLSQIGTIVGEQVDVRDLQSGINATRRTIARLQRQLRTLRGESQTTVVKQQIAAITAHIQRLQRSLASTERGARYATVELTLSTPPHAQPVHKPKHHGPLHGLGVAFRWLGIGLIYATALGGVAIALAALVWLSVRAARRRRVEALISRP